MSLFGRNKRAREDGDEAAATQPGLAGADHHTHERSFAGAAAPAAASGAAHRGLAELDVLVGEAPSSRRRGKLRRRLRHLRRVREVLLRDLGGLTFELHRAGGGADGVAGDVFQGKLARLFAVDREIRELEEHLSDHRAMIVREPGIGGTCAECGELFGSEARFCWACGNPVATGTGGAPHLAAWTTRPQLAGGAPVPAPAPPLQAPSVDSTWVEHAAEEPPAAPPEEPPAAPHEEPPAAPHEEHPTAPHEEHPIPPHEEHPTAPLPQMDPATAAAAAEAPAANEPATGDVGGESGAVWSDHMPASPERPPAERPEHAAPDVSSGDPLASPQRPAQS